MDEGIVLDHHLRHTDTDISGSRTTVFARISKYKILKRGKLLQGVNYSFYIETLHKTDFSTCSTATSQKLQSLPRLPTACH